MAEKSLEKTVFIINPKAGKLGLSSKLRLINKNYKDKNSEIFVCGCPDETSCKANQEARKGNLVVACGGDGTVNTIAKEIIKVKGIMAILPMGRGNDFAKNLGITSYEKAFTALQEKIYIEAKYLTLEFEKNHKGIGLTCAGVGMLSAAAFRATKIPILKGKILYLAAAIISLLKLKSYHYKVRIDKKWVALDSIILVIAAGKFTGGGLPIAPEANLHKEKLNLLAAKKINKFKALSLINKVAKGKHLSDPAVEASFGCDFEIESNTKDEHGKHVYADGEYQGDTPVKISIGKDSLKVLVSHND